MKVILTIFCLITPFCFGKSVKVVFSEDYSMDDASFIVTIKYSYADKSLLGNDIYFNATKFTDIKKDDLYNREIKELFKHLVLALNLPKDMFKAVMEANGTEVMKSAIIEMFIASDFMLTAQYNKTFAGSKSNHRHFYFYKDQTKWKMHQGVKDSLFKK